MNIEQGITNVEVQGRHVHNFIFQNSVLLVRHSIFILTLIGTLPIQAAPQAASTTTDQSIANAFADLVEQAIPREYEKRKDWGKTKNITIGIRNDGWKLSRRKKPVNHGVWKHYKVRLVEPDENFKVRIEKLRNVESGRAAFTLVLEADLDTWARAKIYPYGIHLIALEAVGDTSMVLALDCEVGIQLDSDKITINPSVVNASLQLKDFHLHRVSNAKGPIIRELGDGLQKLIEHELKGPKLVAKLNRAIDKKRDR